jgi:hypothetical protein
MQASLCLTPRERSRFILSTLKHLCREPRFRHQWRSADHLSTLCHKWFTIPEPLQFNGNDINNALRKDPALQLDIKAEKLAPNQFGIYHDVYRPMGPTNTNKITHCYYLCDPGIECVKSPPVGKKWYHTIPDMVDEIQAPLERASRNKEQRQFPADVIDLVSKAKTLVQERDTLENERPTKRRCLGDETNDSSNNSAEPMGITNGCDFIDDEAAYEAASGPRPPQLAPGYNIWWDSREAQKLFNVCKEQETVINRLEDFIAILDNANSTALSYKTIVDGHDADDTLSEHKKESIRMKARYLAQAYRIAVEEMPFKTWFECCQEAIDRLATVHIFYIKMRKFWNVGMLSFVKRKHFM